MKSIHTNPSRNAASRGWRNTRSVAVLAASIGLGLFGSQAAADSKYLPGAICNANVPANINKLEYSTRGRVSNTSTSLAFVTCPLPRDSTVDPWNDLAIQIDDRHSTQNVRCTLNLVDQNGSIRQTRTMRSNGTGTQVRGVSRDRQDCSFPSTCVGEDPIPNGTYVVSCMPPGLENIRAGWASSGVVRLELHERD